MLVKSRAAAGPAGSNSILRDAAALERSGRIAEARARYLALTRSVPHSAAYEGAARTAARLGDHRAAAEHWRAASGLAPDRQELRANRVMALFQAGDLAAAATEAEALLNMRPGDVQLLNLFGVIQKRMGRIAEALAAFEKGATIDPQNHSPWYNLGNTLLGLGDAARALDPLRRAAELKPRDSETARLFGRALAETGRDEEAGPIFDRAQALDPKNARVYATRAAWWQRLGAPASEVLAEIERALALDPNNIEHLSTKAALLSRHSRFAEAEAMFREILRRDPDHLETLLRLGYLLGYTLRRYEEANGFLRHALERNPGDARCLSALCKSLIDSRYGTEWEHIEEAGTIARRLLAAETNLKPHAATLAGIFLRLADFEGLAAIGDPAELMPFWVERMNVGALHNQLGRVVTTEDRRELVHWHREWGKRVEATAAKTPVTRQPARRATREKIRVGILSSDLRDHPVCYFALPIFEHYDRDRFELYCYSFYPAPPDQVQSFVEQRVASFRSMLEASDQEVAQRIADDDLDILFEFGGSTRYNRLDVLAYRAAPRQVSWLGYPHSAGLATIDYILVDPYLKPADPTLLIEQPFDMPESWVSLGRLGFRDIPIEPGLPEDRAGALTFGTMNNPYKYTPELFALWAEVMRRVPGSQFLFVRPESGAPSFRRNVCRLFGAEGVAAERIRFEAVRGRHLPYYNRIDIALDTAPHTGGTTTCETLWMGVPTVTLVGEAFFERLSYSNLSNAGLADLCAFSRASYVETAVALARDRARRLDLRHNLRQRIRQTPLGDTKRWVRHLEAAITRATNGTAR